MWKVGLNPYGIAYTMGLWGRDTARANPGPMTFDGYIDLTAKLGLGGVEIYIGFVAAMGDDGLKRLRERLAALGFFSVLSCPLADAKQAVTVARVLGVSVVRMHLSPILQGDRALPEHNWPGLVKSVRQALTDVAMYAGEYGISLAIEDHQDFTSQELMELCQTCGRNVGICLDCGNALSVGEDPVTFAATVAPRVIHVHLKDYVVHWSGEGYRLVRCAIGDGAVPFAEIAKVLERPEVLPACIEPGALNARHIRLLNPHWWQYYPPRSAAALAAGLRAARVARMKEDEDWRTPWERNAAPEEIVRYEMGQLYRSVENLKAMGMA